VHPGTRQSTRRFVASGLCWEGAPDLYGTGGFAQAGGKLTIWVSQRPFSRGAWEAWERRLGFGTGLGRPVSEKLWFRIRGWLKARVFPAPVRAHQLPSLGLSLPHSTQVSLQLCIQAEAAAGALEDAKRQLAAAARETREEATLRARAQRQLDAALGGAPIPVSTDDGGTAEGGGGGGGGPMLAETMARLQQLATDEEVRVCSRDDPRY
jgi:hypothetical protein